LTEEIDNLRASTVKYYANTTAVSRTTDALSTHYQPRDEDEKDQFIDLLFSELLLYNLSVEGNLEQLREWLLSKLILEEKYRASLQKLAHCTALEVSAIALMHKIPCILHGENRVGIKLLTMVLMEGVSNAIERKIFGHINSIKERIKAYAMSIENLLNQQILGDDDGPAQWSIPMSDDGKTVGAITSDNNRIRLILNSFEMLINASIIDITRREKYHFSIPHYRDAMTIVWQQQEYTDNDIITYQNHVDTWFQIWNELHGASGCTNYTHMLSSGHLAEYMFKWRSLYQFLQQGFEKFNHVFSTFYFRRTKNGGCRQRDAAKSKLLAIGRWLQ
jgi:hypothetical protein